MDQPRSSGLLLHITSLPSPYGIGDLGPSAYGFADFLYRTGQQLWQVLPLVPVGQGHSPYASPSTFAGNPLLISPDRLLEQGLLHGEDVADRPDFPADRIDFERASAYKYRLLERAYARFEAGQGHLPRNHFDHFCRDNAHWLDDYALFMAMKDCFEQRSWTDWPAELATRQPKALEAFRAEHGAMVRRHQFWQFVFAEQWEALKHFCHTRHVRIFGDLPIYVAHDSADVWGHPDLFYLDDDGLPTVVSGVPPDYFSETGQRWGNPLYRWDVMAERDYTWWAQRMARVLDLVDLLRLDHFRGFSAYWEIPGEAETAIDGRWVDGPGADLFESLRRQLGALPVVAEDLGIITEDVTALMEQFDFPGMAVIQFAFDDDAHHPFLPHNYKRNLIAYSGTHDNDTFVGWWDSQHHGHDDVSRARRYAHQYLRMDACGDQGVHWAVLHALMASPADIVVSPLQDVLGLGSEARMNVPGLGEGNWGWRFRPEMLTDHTAHQLRLLTELYGRTPKVKG